MKKRIIPAVLFCGLFLLGLASGSAAEDGSALFARCARCHGDNGDKQPHVLKGQTADAILGKLHGYAAGTYGGEKKSVMHNMTKNLSEADMQALAAHISKL